MPLKNTDEILILGKLDGSEKPIFWRLHFIDPEETNHVVQFQANSTIEYSFSQQRLVRTTSRDRQEIVLQDKELALVDYMSRKNYENNNQPVICEYKELIKAI